MGWDDDDEEEEEEGEEEQPGKEEGQGKAVPSSECEIVNADKESEEEEEEEIEKKEAQPPQIQQESNIEKITEQTEITHAKAQPIHNPNDTTHSLHDTKAHTSTPLDSETSGDDTTSVSRVSVSSKSTQDSWEVRFFVFNFFSFFYLFFC